MKRGWRSVGGRNVGRVFESSRADDKPRKKESPKEQDGGPITSFTQFLMKARDNAAEVRREKKL